MTEQLNLLNDINRVLADLEAFEIPKGHALDSIMHKIVLAQCLPGF